MTGETVGERLASGVDSTADAESRLCAAIGLDPAEVTEVHIEIQAGRGAALRWTSVRPVDLDRIVAALQTWEVPPDPWGKSGPSCDALLDEQTGARCLRSAGHDGEHDGF